MKKGFPNKILFIPYGWKDRGGVAEDYDYHSETFQYFSCSRCKTRARIGIDYDTSRFIFCPKCIVKLVKPTQRSNIINNKTIK